MRLSAVIPTTTIWLVALVVLSEREINVHGLQIQTVYLISRGLNTERELNYARHFLSTLEWELQGEAEGNQKRG